MLQKNQSSKSSSNFELILIESLLTAEKMPTLWEKILIISDIYCPDMIDKWRVRIQFKECPAIDSRSGIDCEGFYITVIQDSAYFSGTALPSEIKTIRHDPDFDIKFEKPIKSTKLNTRDAVPSRCSFISRRLNTSQKSKNKARYKSLIKEVEKTEEFFQNQLINQQETDYTEIMEDEIVSDKAFATPSMMPLLKLDLISYLSINNISISCRRNFNNIFN